MEDASNETSNLLYPTVWYGAVGWRVVWYAMVFAGFPCFLPPELDGWANGDIPQLNLIQSS